MTERTFRIIFGPILLIALYFNLGAVILGLIAVSLFQGVTTWRISRLVTRLRRRNLTSEMENAADRPVGPVTWLKFEAERGLSLTIAAVLTLGCLVFPEQLWFLPWFMGFALFGAGLSGVCPMVIGLRLAGLK
ncbi:MAG: hypothetical protein ACYDDO_02235 [Acidiferrobacterales bacterium]